MHTIYITLGRATDGGRIAGTVKTDGKYVSEFDGIVSGRFLARFPRKAVRDIAQNWVSDGADRTYGGWVDDLSTFYSVHPVSQDR